MPLSAIPRQCPICEIEIKNMFFKEIIESKYNIYGKLLKRFFFNIKNSKYVRIRTVTQDKMTKL